MSKKNLARLTPVKRNVINRQTGSVSDVTYYIDPNKDKKKSRRTKKADPETSNKRTKQDDDTTKTGGIGAQGTEPSGKSIQKDEGDKSTNLSSPEDIKKGDTPDKMMSGVDKKAGSPENIKKDSSGNIFEGVNDFEDFGKKGIDPTAARQFFCNL